MLQNCFKVERKKQGNVAQIIYENWYETEGECKQESRQHDRGNKKKKAGDERAVEKSKYDKV